MISAKDLRKLARARLQDAQVLFKARRFDGSYYIAGYAVELALKARICRTLKWAEFPLTSAEFEGLRSLKTHDLEVLRKLSGIEAKIRATLAPEWSVVSNWNPEKRYQATSHATAADAKDMLTCTKRLLELL